MAPADHVEKAPFGTYVGTICGCSAFVPHAPPNVVTLSSDVQGELDRADAALKSLNETYRDVRVQGVLKHPLLRQEAVASLAIDGISVPIPDLYAFLAGLPNLQYSEHAWLAVLLAEAIENTLDWSEEDGQSLQRMLLLHQRLFADRSSSRDVGILRRTQTWVGGDVIHRAEYVPPPPSYVENCMREYFDFVRAKGSMPALIRIGVSHYHFEAIHPFFAGNGVIGRVQIALQLRQSGLVTAPILVLSEAFSRSHARYREMLGGVSKRGDLSAWLSFFLQEVTRQAEQDRNRITALADVYEDYTVRLENVPCKVPERRLVALLFENPFVTRESVLRSLGDRYKAPWVVVDKYKRAGVIDRYGQLKHGQPYCAVKLLRLLRSAPSGVSKDATNP